MVGGTQGESVPEPTGEERVGGLHGTDLHSDLQLVRELAQETEEHWRWGGGGDGPAQDMEPTHPQLQ